MNSKQRRKARREQARAKRDLLDNMHALANTMGTIEVRREDIETDSVGVFTPRWVDAERRTHRRGSHVADVEVGAAVKAGAMLYIGADGKAYPVQRSTPPELAKLDENDNVRNAIEKSAAAFVDLLKPMQRIFFVSGRRSGKTEAMRAAMENRNEMQSAFEHVYKDAPKLDTVIDAKPMTPAETWPFTFRRLPQPPPEGVALCKECGGAGGYGTEPCDACSATGVE